MSLLAATMPASTQISRANTEDRFVLTIPHYPGDKVVLTEQSNIFNYFASIEQPSIPL